MTTKEEMLLEALKEADRSFEFLAAVPPHNPSTLIHYCDMRRAEIREVLAKARLNAES